jgi:hypothetical protein
VRRIDDEGREEVGGRLEDQGHVAIGGDARLQERPARLAVDEAHVGVRHRLLARRDKARQPVARDGREEARAGREGRAQRERARRARGEARQEPVVGDPEGVDACDLDATRQLHRPERGAVEGEVAGVADVGRDREQHVVRAVGDLVDEGPVHELDVGRGQEAGAEVCGPVGVGGGAEAALGGGHVGDEHRRQPQRHSQPLCERRTHILSFPPPGRLPPVGRPPPEPPMMTEAGPCVDP